jgi:hypothetical protein
MLSNRSRLGFLDEPSLACGVGDSFGRKDLDGDEPAGVRVAMSS